MVTAFTDKFSLVQVGQCLQRPTVKLLIEDPRTCHQDPRLVIGSRLLFETQLVLEVLRYVIHRTRV